MLESTTTIVLGGILGLIVVLAIIAVLAMIFRWLWNSTMPDVFGIKELTLWQTIKILVLASILFGGHRTVDIGRNVVSSEGASAVSSQVLPAKK